MKKLMIFILCILFHSILYAQRPSGSALELDGDGDYMQLSDFADSLIFTAPVTIEFWARANFDHRFDLGMIWTTNDGNAIATSGAESFELRYGSQSSALNNEWLSIFYSLGTLANTNVYGIEDNTTYTVQWHHFAVVADSSNYSVYIDGQLRSLTPNSSSGNGIAMDYGAGFSPKINAVLGARILDNTPSYEFKGALDEFRIWNVVRSPAQIQSTMNDTLGPAYYSTNDSGLVGYWRFDKMEDLGINGDGADDIRDYSTHGYHGDLAGNAVAELESFTKVMANMDNVWNSSAAWGDYDNDRDLDICLSGEDKSGNAVSKIYQNNGGTFTDIDAGLPAVYNSSVSWGDYDGDGYLDLFLSGYSPQRISKIYRNLTSGGLGFIDINADLTGVGNSAAAWGDYDNDGDADLLISGYSVPDGVFCAIYRNQVSIGAGFADINASLPGVQNGSLAWGDYDNDGDLDILLTGLTGSGNTDPKVTKIFRNDNGHFTDINAALSGVFAGSAAWGDYDMDGDLDILLTGADNTGQEISKIYRNDDSTFIDINSSLTGDIGSSALWGDYDNDGDLDVLLRGDHENLSKIYRNDDSTFSDIDAPLTGTGFGSTAWGDYDDDGDLDILLTGQGQNNYFTRVYQNNINRPNTAPDAPANLHVSRTDTTALFSWSAASDAETPSSGLTYNMRIGTTPGGGEVMSPMAGSNGHRRVAQLGNVNHNLSWKIRNLPNNTTYYWSVQAIDNSFAGGAWADEQTFTIGTTGIGNLTEEIPYQFSLSQNFPNPFNPKTVISWQLAVSSHVDLSIYNILGQKVATLINEKQEAGSYQMEWYADAFPSGVYFYRIEAGDFVQTKRMLLIK